MKNIAIFASGSGTNAENIINYFKNNDDVNIALIVSNKKDAYVLERAKKYGIRTSVLPKKDFQNKEKVLQLLKENNIDFIVLAGFLLLIPEFLIDEYPDKIINIHPALLPKYGGKGMYGDNVHKAVIEAKEKESGITIHYVNKDYDKGEIIFQAKCKIDENDSYQDLASKIHSLEYEYFPKIIEQVLEGK